MEVLHISEEKGEGMNWGVGLSGWLGEATVKKERKGNMIGLELIN